MEGRQTMTQEIGFGPAELELPSRRARFMFALGIHQLALSLALIAAYLVLATMTGAVIASLSDRRLMLALFVIISCCGGIVTFIAVKPPWLAKPAAAGHIAAALIAATDHERPHLVARIHSRLHNPHWPEAMTLSELAALFVLTRDEYGELARRRRAKAAEARAAQQGIVSDFAVNVRWERTQSGRP